MMTPAISIVIPARNAAEWIGETLHSVAHQTHPRSEVELLVVDDASTDDTPAIANRFLQEHALAGRVISCQKNVGVSAARNVGWRAASAPWVQFLDADDLLAPAKLAHQAAYASKLPDEGAVIYSAWQRFGLHEGKWQPLGPTILPRVDDDAIVQLLIDERFWYMGPVLIRRAFLESVSGFDESLRLGEDSDLLLRIAMAGGRFQNAPSPEALFFYRDTPGSLWRESVGSVEATRKLMGVWRRAEMFLRERDGGKLSAPVRRALVTLYSRDFEGLFEHDRESFNAGLRWVRNLGATRPHSKSRSVRLLSRIIGYENAQMLRLSVRAFSRVRRSSPEV